MKIGYLNDIPDDLFADGEPFHYALTEADDRGAGYRLYSVGPNGKDDGGFNKYDKCSETEDENEKKDGDDIKISINRP